MTKQSMGSQTALFPTPVLLVGTYDASGKANVMTAAWGGVCNSSPACINVCIRRERHTHAAIMQRKAFTISLPGESLVTQTDYVGMASGKHIDKFSVSGLTSVHSTLVDAPYVEECPVVLELSLHSWVDLPSHTVFIGQVEDVKAAPGCLDEHGNIDFFRSKTLIYDTSSKCYAIPGSVVGKAFNIGKALLGKKSA